MSNKQIKKPYLTKSLLVGLVILIWAMIYLSGLGTLEFQGTENKRAEPALTMLKTGNYTVPYLTGRQYLSKPPLIFWLISASYYLTGDHTEWAARLPSAIAILVFVTIIMLSEKSFIPLEGRFMISLIFMTTIGTVLKGRQCEIEALYTALTGIALWIWLHSEIKDTSMGWTSSLLIGVVLGFGLLTKGPLILLFFYLPVVFLLYRRKMTRKLLSIPYMLVIVIAIAVFCCWAIQVYDQIPAQKETVNHTWYVQIMSRLSIARFRFGKWFGGIGGAFFGFLPWVLLLPFMFCRKLRGTISNRTKFIACLQGTVLAFILVVLMPGMHARYAIPLIANYSILSGWFLCSLPETSLFFATIQKCNLAVAAVLLLILSVAVLLIPSGLICDIFPTLFTNSARAVVLPESQTDSLLLLAIAGIMTAISLLTRRFLPRLRHLTFSGVLVGSAMISFSVLAPPFIKPFEMKRRFGHEVSSVVPEKYSIYHYCLNEGVGYQPFSYYIDNPLHYVYSDREIIESPPDSYALVRKNLYEGLLKQTEFTSRHPAIIKQLLFKHHTYCLIRLE